MQAAKVWVKSVESVKEIFMRNKLMASSLKENCTFWHKVSGVCAMENTTVKTREALVSDVDKLKKNAVQVVQDVKDHANAHVDETKQRVNETVQSVRENMTSHPFTVLAIGFGLGLLFGCRWSR